MTRISINDLSFAWPGQDQTVVSIDHFSLEAGERLLLQGPSGSGKSTLLSAISGITSLPNGAVEVVGTDIAKLSSRRRDQFRADHLGMIFQVFNLIPWMSARENILLPITYSKMRKARLQLSPQAEADRLLKALGLDPATVGLQPAANLSVGQQQRVAAARALIGSPEVILADEPTSALDERAKHRFMDVLNQQVQDTGASLLMVSHDETLGRHFDRVVSFEKLNKCCAVAC
ncbi:ABC transporter ATP-binding protein [Shimia sp.]|uniref:ABC transporter ATP-binding protein n=1 Tax=Shimia sp. TaxID=1954381 RepID=UPI003B8B84E4